MRRAGRSIVDVEPKAKVGVDRLRHIAVELAARSPGIAEEGELHERGAAAERARDLGFEWLELHFAHGYLGQSFFSIHANQREDEYGGTAENRGRFILETLREVRKILVGRPEGDRMIILISDGQSSDLSGGAAAKIGQELAADNITTFYIHAAEGSPQDETFTLASLTGGQAFAAGDPSARQAVSGRPH